MGEQTVSVLNARTFPLSGFLSLLLVGVVRGAPPLQLLGAGEPLCHMAASPMSEQTGGP